MSQHLVLALFVVSCLSPRAVRAQSSMEPDLVESVVDDTDDATAAPSDGDVTESIGESLPVVVDVPSPGPTQASSDEGSSRTKVTGWARESLEWYFNDRGRVRGSRDDLRVPRERLISHTQLLVRANHQRGRNFEAVASGALGINAYVEGSGRDLPAYELQSQGTSVLHDARLMELYLGFFFDSFDLRIGQQRVAWGQADVLSPNDVVNARDVRDPFLAEPEWNHSPTPMVRGTLYLGSVVTLEGLISPVFVPDKFSVYGHNWSAVQPDAPATYRGLFNLIGRGFHESIQEQLNDALTQTRLPNRDGAGFMYGARLGIRSERVDFNAYYHYGYDGTPYLWLDPAFQNVLDTTDFTSAGFADLTPILRALDRGFAPIFAEYVRRHHAGFDLTTQLGPFMLRIDAAYQSQRVFYHEDLTGFRSPTVLAVASLELQTADLHKVLIVEGVYIRLLNEPDAPLLVYRQQSYGLAAVVRWPLFARLGFEVRTTLGIAPRHYTVQPSLVVDFADIALRIGGFVANGQESSLGGYYRHNTNAYLQVRYTF